MVSFSWILWLWAQAGWIYYFPYKKFPAFTKKHSMSGHKLGAIFLPDFCIREHDEASKIQSAKPAYWSEEVNHLIVFNGQMCFQSEFKIALSLFCAVGEGWGEKAKKKVVWRNSNICYLYIKDRILQRSFHWKGTWIPWFAFQVLNPWSLKYWFNLARSLFPLPIHFIA